MSRRKRWADSKFQRLPLEALSVKALSQVLKLQRAYASECQDYEVRRTRNEAEKKSLISALSSAEQRINELEPQIGQLFAQLVPFEIGFVGKWLSSEPTIKSGGRYYRPEAQSLIDTLHHVYKRRKELDDLRLSLQQTLRNVEGRPEFSPKRGAKLRYQFQTFIFDIGAINPEQLQRIIAKKQNKATLEQEREHNKHERVQTKLEQTKARAAAYEDKQRELAKSIRAALRKDLKGNPYCPYCNSELSIENAHADHIHPVVKGGLSTTGNMVFICQSCNNKKGTLTLRGFLKKMGYVEADIYERLELMGKDI